MANEGGWQDSLVTQKRQAKPGTSCPLPQTLGGQESCAEATARWQAARPAERSCQGQEVVAGQRARSGSIQQPPD